VPAGPAPLEVPQRAMTGPGFATAWDSLGLFHYSRCPRNALRLQELRARTGPYLAEWLLDRGYQVHGIVRRVALEDPDHRLSGWPESSPA